MAQPITRQQHPSLAGPGYSIINHCLRFIGILVAIHNKTNSSTKFLDWIIDMHQCDNIIIIKRADTLDLDKKID